MYKKKVLIGFLCFLAFGAIFGVAKAATITSATLDEDVYLAGQIGYISVTVYNDKSNKIRVTELGATIDYYYSDGTVYIQKFFTDATLSDEISVGQSETYRIPISLPTNIASGYLNPIVEARTEIWSPLTERWVSSDRANYHLKLFIESLYKQSTEKLNNTVYMLVATTILFATAAAGFLFILFARRPRRIAQS
jgi:hypothetical protein